MERELSWPGRQPPRRDRLETGTEPLLAPRHHVGSMQAQGPLQHAFALEQHDEDRRISTAGAFIMFIFGVVCGAAWTMVLTWLFN